MRPRKSSFHDDLISHFERRLSDLGPRSKYPYLQKIARDQGQDTYVKSSLDVGTTGSEEVLIKKRVPNRNRLRGKWWKYIKTENQGEKDLEKGNTTKDSNCAEKGYMTKDQTQKGYGEENQEEICAEKVVDCLKNGDHLDEGYRTEKSGDHMESGYNHLDEGYFTEKCFIRKGHMEGVYDHLNVDYT